ncbi:MAG: translation initiation factor 2 [Pseudomonadota bacterium]
MRKLICVAITLAMTGCASITRGVNSDVVIQYEPADATVTTSLQHRCTASPCSVRVPRKETFQVVAQRQGYISQTVQVTTKVSGSGAAGFAGNALLGGVVGMGVDVATGAALEHNPNPVIIQLKPETSQTVIVPVEPISEPQPDVNHNTPVS